MKDLYIECAYYIGKERQDIDNEFKKVFGKVFGKDLYEVFGDFVRWLCEGITSLQDLYEKLDIISVDCVEEFYGIVNKEKEIDLLEKVNGIIKENKEKADIEKKNCIDYIMSFNDKMRKYFERFDKDMELIKTCHNNNIIDFHKDYKERLMKVSKYGEQVGSTLKIVNLGYKCTKNRYNKIEDIALYSERTSEEKVDFTNISKGFEVLYNKEKGLYLRILAEYNRDENNHCFKIYYNDINRNNELIQKYYKEIVLACKGFEHIVEYLDEVEKIIKEL